MKRAGKSWVLSGINTERFGTSSGQKRTCQSCLSTQNKNGRRGSRSKTLRHREWGEQPRPGTGKLPFSKMATTASSKKEQLWAPPLILLAGLRDKNCIARDKSPAAPNGAGDFPSSPGSRARRSRRALTQGAPPSAREGVGRTPFSNCPSWPVSRTI